MHFETLRFLMRKEVIKAGKRMEENAVPFPPLALSKN